MYFLTINLISMKKMKLTFAFITGCLLLTINVSAQDVKLDYDLAGNRIQRYRVFKSSEVTFSDTTFNNHSIVDDVLIADKKINIFPNPVSNQLNILFSGETFESTLVEISLFDVNGNQLYKVKVSPTNHQIAMQKYPAGFYFLRIADSLKTEQWKIVKN